MNVLYRSEKLLLPKYGVFKLSRSILFTAIVPAHLCVALLKDGDNHFTVDILFYHLLNIYCSHQLAGSMLSQSCESQSGLCGEW